MIIFRLLYVYQMYSIYDIMLIKLIYNTMLIKLIDCYNFYISVRLAQFELPSLLVSFTYVLFHYPQCQIGWEQNFVS